MTVQDVKQISIRLLPDGFSYLNQFHPIQPGADFNKRLEEALIDALKTDDEQASVSGACSVESVRFLLSPLEVDEDLASLMEQKMLPDAEAEERILTLCDSKHGIRFSFGIDDQLYHFMLRNWPDLTFTHPLFELFGQWADSDQIQQDCMVADAGENYLNILVFKGGRLYLANRFEVSGTDNILYHLMNCWTQCGLDVIDHKLYLQTEVQSIRQQIKQYIKQCEL